MTNKKVIIGGVAGVAAVLAVAVFAFAIVGGNNGSVGVVKESNNNKGNGMAEKLEFKNPVTIRLIDKDGNVASETVVYNAITAAGKEYIYKALKDSSSTSPIAGKHLNKMKFVDGTTPTPDSKPLDRYTGTPPTAQNDQPVLASLEASGSTFNCTVPNTNDKVECTGTFNFSSPYQPLAAGTLKLENSNAKIQLGHVDTANQFTPYFEITGTTQSFGDVNQGTQYVQMVITWTIQIP